MVVASRRTRELVPYAVGDFVTFWMWASRNRGRVVTIEYNRHAGAVLLEIMRVSRYNTKAKKWEDLEKPYIVSVPERRIRSKMRKPSTVVYKLRGF